MDIHSILLKLNLPSDQYVVLGSAVLQVHGIRQARDIDIMGTHDLINKLSKSGWKSKWVFRDWTIRRGVKTVVDGYDVEMYSEKNIRSFDTEAKELIRTADIINGIPFMNLTELISLKKALGRKKDFEDIKMIKEYLNNK